MDIFNKKFKSILSKEEQVPDSYSWENMKEGINSNLPAGEKILFKTGFGLSAYIIALLSVAAVLIIVSSLFIYFNYNTVSKDNIQDISENDPINNSSSFEESTAGNIEEFTSNKLIGNVENDAPVLIEESISFANVVETEKPVEIKEKGAKFIEKSNQAIKKNIEKSSNELFVDRSTLAEIEERELNPDEFKIIEKNEQEVNVSSLKEDSFYANRLLPKKDFFVENSSVYLHNVGNVIALVKKEEKKKLGLYFELGGGVNHYLTDYSGNEGLSLRRNETRTALIGQTFSASSGMSFSGKANLSLGICYMNLNERFNYYGEKNIKVLVEKAIVKIDSNLITREISYLKKDTIVNGVEKRTVVHYNNIKNLSFSIAFGKDWDIYKKTYLSTKLGLNYNMIMSSSGRTINAKEAIVDFGDSNSIYTKSQIGVIADFGLYYKLNRHIDIGTSISATKYVTNMSAEADLSLKPTVFSYQIGLKYNI